MRNYACACVYVCMCVCVYAVFSRCFAARRVLNCFLLFLHLFQLTKEGHPVILHDLEINIFFPLIFLINDI